MSKLDEMQELYRTALGVDRQGDTTIYECIICHNNVWGKSAGMHTAECIVGYALRQDTLLQEGQEYAWHTEGCLAYTSTHDYTGEDCNCGLDDWLKAVAQQ